MQSLQWIILLVNVLVHILFASAVARDAGKLNKIGMPIFLVSGVTWAFATLLGGVWVAAVYWFMHRSSFTKVC
jgi:hypothetical protein